jgi:CheY-like chemotaxis protein/anti-sigma regulatory factor (Ser/Thr protein kinase)
LQGDPGRLRQILHNLMSNAIKFTEQGEIVVRAIPDEESDTHVTINFMVCDTGIGISEAARQQLFQPFTQLDGSITRRYGGTGLGLAIAHRLVEMMDGEIDVESEEGQGSIFWFTARFERSPMSHMPQPCSSAHTCEKRILIVGENPTNREILHSHILNWDIRVSAVPSGDEALFTLRAAAEHRPYDLAIIDLSSPAVGKMDSFALACAIRQDAAIAATRLVLLSPVDVSEYNGRLADAGFAAFLTMPIKQAQLLETINNTLSENPGTEPVTQPATRFGSGFYRPVLLAEDNIISQRIGEWHLKKLGYTVHTFANGREVLAALSEMPNGYALILMDCHMPEINGFEATHLIREAELLTGQRIPIIAMTADALEDDRESCLAAGMDDHISKPLHLDTLRKVLQHWLGDPAGAPQHAPKA